VKAFPPLPSLLFSFLCSSLPFLLHPMPLLPRVPMPVVRQLGERQCPLHWRWSSLCGSSWLYHSCWLLEAVGLPSSTARVVAWKQTLGMDELSEPFGTCSVTTQVPSSGEGACTGAGRKEGGFKHCKCGTWNSCRSATAVGQREREMGFSRPSTQCRCRNPVVRQPG